MNNETAEFFCDSIKNWWNKKGKNYYSKADNILVLYDAGGVNSYLHNIFKIELQKLSNSINMPITIAHYPPHTSKWNPIEHRVFQHITRAMSSVPINNPEEAKKFDQKSKNKNRFKSDCKYYQKII